MNQITKVQFDRAYNLYLPPEWMIFAFRYFSKSTVKKDLNVSNTFIITLGILFVLGLVSTMFNMSREIRGMITVAFSIILSVVVLFIFFAWIMNKIRIWQIRKMLGRISTSEYNALVDKYY